MPVGSLANRRHHPRTNRKGARSWPTMRIQRFRALPISRRTLATRKSKATRTAIPNAAARQPIDRQFPHSRSIRRCLRRIARHDRCTFNDVWRKPLAAGSSIHGDIKARMRLQSSGISARMQAMAGLDERLQRVSGRSRRRRGSAWPTRSARITRENFGSGGQARQVTAKRKGRGSKRGGARRRLEVWPSQSRRRVCSRGSSDGPDPC